MLRKQQSNVQEIDVEKEIVAKSHQIMHKIFKINKAPLQTKIDELERDKDLQISKAIKEYG
jgi:hypothetical protein